MPTYRIIGIDVSLTSTAMVELSPDRNNHNPLNIIKQLGFSLPEDASDQAEIERAKIISDGVVGFINNNSTKHTALEGYSYGSSGSRIIQTAELGGIIRYRIVSQNWQFPTLVPPTTLKSFACGKGNASKADVAVGIFKKFGYENSDDNVIDAYALAQMVKQADPQSRDPMKLLNYQIHAMIACGLLDPSDPLCKSM